MTLATNLMAEYWRQQNDFQLNYTEVEYLDTTGLYPIDTGVPMSPDLVIEGTGQNKYRSSAFIRGACKEDPFVYSIFVLSGGSAPNIQGSFNHNGPLNLQVDGIAFDSWFNFKLSNRRLEVNGVVSQTTPEYGLPETTAKMHIGGYYKDWTEDYVVQPAVVGRIRIYRDADMVRDFVPCVRSSDNKRGMYDMCKSVCALTGSPFYTALEFETV